LFQNAGLRSIEVTKREPPIVTDASLFEWTTENLFGERSLWELGVEGGAAEEQVRLVHEDMLRQVKNGGMKFGTGAIFCKGTQP
jgi:hypothetical protein